MKQGGIAGIGKWPVSGAQARADNRLIKIGPEERLRVIQGATNHFLTEFFVSNDFIDFGKSTLPRGFYSDAMTHDGDTVVYVLKGRLTIQELAPGDETSTKVLFETRDAWEGDRALIRSGTKHRFMNFSDGNTELIFAIAPRNQAGR